MTHSYPLHTDLYAPCWCCQARQPFKFTSATDQVVCSYCARHLGSEKAELRDQQHVGMWVELFRDAEESHKTFAEQAQGNDARNEATIAELGVRIDELTLLAADRFEQTSTGGIRSLVENEVVKRAERNTLLAQRSNDVLMAVLWRINTLHGESETSPRNCTCGASVMQCPVWKAIDPMRPKLRDWESKNVRLLREGKRHGLPDDHPEVAQTAGGTGGRQLPARP